MRLEKILNSGDGWRWGTEYLLPRPFFWHHCEGASGPVPEENFAVQKSQVKTRQLWCKPAHPQLPSYSLHLRGMRVLIPTKVFCLLLEL